MNVEDRQVEGRHAHRWGHGTRGAHGAHGTHGARGTHRTHATTGTEDHHTHEESAENERFLRPYAIEAGTLEQIAQPDIRPTEIELLTLVMAARNPGGREWLRPEREAILNHALSARTVAELAAEVALPVGQVRVMVAEMLSEGSLQRCGPSRDLERQDILHAVLVGLRAL
ncbi:DUF742 domain-containing protein [Nocardiopsis alkaliphila]|uniref:DUF742 domain-containing protein n=1 Tax=Nocardiopsis alkaliphila TaxID=225762 RepID=UPI000349D169|nr:DUF742 domain-containing protein [Nocardiopsis alkaliphila]